MLATSRVFTGLLKATSELMALKLLKSRVPTSRAAASRMAPTSSSLRRDRKTTSGLKKKNNQREFGVTDPERPNWVAPS